MSFLAPLFLLAALGLGFPVLFHLIRRTTRHRTAFSSLMFLSASPPRLTQHSRLEHILLLLLRCSVLCLLALGFSRPFIKKPMTSAPEPVGKRILVLVDTSASMRRANLWVDARNRIQAVLRRISTADQVSLFAFDRDMKPLMSFEEWKAAAPGERAALALARVADLAPGWGTTRLDSALLRASEILADNSGKQAAGPAEIVLITDLQEGSHLELLQGAQWPRNIEVAVELLKPKRLSNAWLQVVAGSEDSDPQSTPQVRIRVENASNSTRDQFRVGWSRTDAAGFFGTPNNIYVPPGQSRIISLPADKAGSLSRVLLQGDEEEFDNAVFVVSPEPTRFNVLYLGSESEQDSRQPLYFLRRAFQQTRQEIVQVQSQTPDQPVSDAQLQAANLVVVHDKLPASLATGLRNCASGGKTLLILLTDAAQGAGLATLLGLNDLSVAEVRPTTYAMLGEIDLRAPVFAPFADPRFSDFTSIHFWKYRRLDIAGIPQAHALAKFDNGDPALLEAPVEKGRVLVLTSGWDPADSQLALSTKFVPLLYSMLETTAAPVTAPASYTVGDPILLSAKVGPGDTMKMVTPENKERIVPPGNNRFSDTLIPGIYALSSIQPPQHFAVNIDPAESRTSPMSPDVLSSLGVPLQKPTPPAWVSTQKQVRLANVDLENRQKLWRWLLISALLLLLVETWLAGAIQRRAAVTTPLRSKPMESLPVAASPTS